MTQPKKLKTSQLFKIQAAVMEQMEEVGFEPQYAPVLLQTDDADNFSMTFLKKDTTLAELNAVMNKLGRQFDLVIEAKDKPVRLHITVKAPKKEFLKLLDDGQEEPEEPEPPIDFDSNV